jgi:hypothetical protein
MADVVRVVRWFDKSSDRLVGEAVMASARLEELQALFDVAPDNPMYDSWIVGPNQAGALSRMTGVPVDLDRFDYFVDAHAASEGDPA